MEEYVHISFERYKELADTIQTLTKENDEYEDALCESKEIISELKKNEFIIAGLKKALMQYTIDKHMVKYYSMEELTNPESWKFAFEDVKVELAEAGITIEEMIDFTRTYKAQYEAEKAAEEAEDGQE